MFGFWFFDRGLSFSNVTARLIASVVAVIWFLPFHEIAHMWTACLFSEKKFNFKEFSLFDFFDPFGAVCMVLFGYGWAKRYQYYITEPKSRREKVIIYAAGPLFNFFSAIVLGLLFNILAILDNFFVSGLFWFLKFMNYLISINVTLTVFNLIPVPQLDGFKIIETFIPKKFLSRYYQNYVPISIMLAILLLFGFFNAPLRILENAVYTCVKVLSGIPFLFLEPF